MTRSPPPLREEIAACRLCADRFAATATAHRPRPIPWFARDTPILVASQAPGMRVHVAGKPFWDRSGARLRDWMGITEAQFHDRSLVSVLPTAFCFPGYDAKGSDLPPPPVCWDTWHARALREIGAPEVTLIVGGYAMKRHLGLHAPVSEVIRGWRDHAPGVFVLPHPSWRNTAWLRRNPVFGAEVVPALRAAIATVLRRHDRQGPPHSVTSR